MYILNLLEHVNYMNSNDKNIKGIVSNDLYAINYMSYITYANSYRFRAVDQLRRSRFQLR